MLKIYRKIKERKLISEYLVRTLKLLNASNTQKEKKVDI